MNLQGYRTYDKNTNKAIVDNKLRHRCATHDGLYRWAKFSWNLGC